MLMQNYFSTLIPFLTAQNVSSLMLSDIESLPVKASEGFVNVGCFCKLGEDGESIENLDDDSTAENVYGFVLDNGKATVRNGRRVLTNGQIAQVLRMNSVFRATPVIIDDLDRVPDTLKVIKWSNDGTKYPVGAIIFSAGDTDEYHTLEITGKLIEYDTE